MVAVAAAGAQVADRAPGAVPPQGDVAAVGPGEDRVQPGRQDRALAQQRLVARGVLTPPLKRMHLSASWPEPPGNVSDNVMERVWRQERDDR